MIFLKYILYIVCCTLFLTSCGNRDNEQKNGGEQQEIAFHPPEVPAMLSGKERNDYIIGHYWDALDYSDTSGITGSDVVEQAFARYVKLISDSADHASHISGMMDKAKCNPQIFNYFVSLYDKYLYNPNSPLRNETVYISFLEYLIGCDMLDDASRARYNFRLGIARQNRPGEVANDFTFTTETPNGTEQTRNMHSIKADYLIIFFNNPDCTECKRTKEYMCASPIIDSMIHEGSLTVLSVYPDADLEAWRNCTYPEEWINGYDKGQTIANELLYDLKAIPTLYLLDSGKRVLLKDENIEKIEAYLLKKDE